MSVVSINGGAVFDPRKPNEALVEFLADLLDRARAGEIVGVAMATLDANRAAAYHAVGMIGGFSMVGALETAKLEVIAAAVGGDE